MKEIKGKLIIWKSIFRLINLLIVIKCHVIPNSFFSEERLKQDAPNRVLWQHSALFLLALIVTAVSHRVLSGQSSSYFSCRLDAPSAKVSFVTFHDRAMLFRPNRSKVVEGVIPEDMVGECTKRRQELIGIVK